MPTQRAYQSYSADSIRIDSPGNITKKLLRALGRDYRRFGYFDRVFQTNSPSWLSDYADKLITSLVEGRYQPKPLISVTDLSGKVYRTLNSIDDLIFAKYITISLRPAIESLRFKSGVGPALIYLPKRFKMDRSLRFDRYRPARYRQIHWLLNVQQCYAKSGFKQALFLDVKSCVASCDRQKLLDLLVESNAPHWAAQQWIDAMHFWAEGKPKGTIPTPPRTTFLYPFTWLILRRVADRLVNEDLQFILSLDDFCFFCSSPDEVSSITDRVRDYLAEEGLSLNESKTRIVDSESYTNLLEAEARNFRLTSLERAVARLIHFTRKADILRSTRYAPILREISRFYLETTTKRLVEGHSADLDPVPLWIDSALEEITSGGVDGTYLPILDMIHWRLGQAAPAPGFLHSWMQVWGKSGNIYLRALSHAHV